MKWIKASEETSPHYERVCCRNIKMPGFWFTAFYDHSKNTYCPVHASNLLYHDPKEIEWLSEPPAPIPSQEGEEKKALQEENENFRNILTGREEDPHIWAINWLSTLLRICKNKPVMQEIIKDQGGDADSVLIMFSELETLTREGNRVLASQPGANPPTS